MSEDIRPILGDWEYRPGKISVRKIMGGDGRPKIQMRLDLGLIQMETQGRPDGARPEGRESLLDHYQIALEKYRAAHQSDLGFELSADDCRRLRDEALMYYHRYLACFILEDYEQVIRDTERNIQVFDLCNRYASKKSDRMVLEQYRPYVIMMNTRGKAHLALEQNRYREAQDHIKAGLRAIKKIYDDIDQPEDFKSSAEATVLRQLARKIRRLLPADPIKLLERRLRYAVRHEQYEEAAKLRDQIDRMREAKDAPDGGTLEPEDL